VKQRRLRFATLVFTLGAIMMLGACKKKVAPPPPPPPPPPAAPTASLTANPNTVEKGQSTTLTWQTSNATDASIDGIGAVQPNGSQSVTPTDSTTYTLTAKGAGGTQTATARVTVSAAPPPPPQAQRTAAASSKDCAVHRLSCLISSPVRGLEPPGRLRMACREGSARRQCRNGRRPLLRDG